MSIKDRVEQLNVLISKMSDDTNLSLIDKDLLLEKVRELYSLLNDIQTVDSLKELPKDEPPVKQNDIEPSETVIAQKPLETEKSTEPDTVSEIDKVTTERATQFSTLKNNANVATLFDDSDMEQTVNIDELNTSVHEKMTNLEQDETIVEKLKKNPVGDLKKSIGINEKFSFINELFEGNLQNYNDSIEILNKELSQQSATSKMEEIADTMKWDKNSSTYIELYSLIERRFKQ